MRKPKLRKLTTAALGLVLIGAIAAASSGKNHTTNTGATSSPALVQTTDTTKSAPVHHAAPPAKPQTFQGQNTENIGTIHVPVDSVLHWKTENANSNFIINNDFNDENSIDVNALNQGAGKTVVPAGNYHKVEVIGDGHWSFTITPGTDR